MLLLDVKTPSNSSKIRRRTATSNELLFDRARYDTSERRGAAASFNSYNL